MPFFGFLTEEDLKPLATKDDLKLLATKDDLKPFASGDQLDVLSDKNTTVTETTNELGKNITTNSSLIKSINEKVKENNSIIESLNEKSETNCTKLLNGIHICDKPSYDNVKTPFEITYKDIFQGSDLCIGVKSIYDVVPPKYREKVSARYLTGLDSDFTGNYICIEGKKGRNYVDTWVDSKIVDHMSEHGDEYPFYKINPSFLVRPQCSNICKNYTCDEIKNGFAIKDMEVKERENCVSMYKKMFEEKQKYRNGEPPPAHVLARQSDNYANYNCNRRARAIGHPRGKEECFGCDATTKCNLTKL
jgi:hypothetical protein